MTGIAAGGQELSIGVFTLYRMRRKSGDHAIACGLGVEFAQLTICLLMGIGWPIRLMVVTFQPDAVGFAPILIRILSTTVATIAGT